VLETRLLRTTNTDAAANGSDVFGDPVPRATRSEQS
jgi:hypothetical protein